LLLKFGPPPVLRLGSLGSGRLRTPGVGFRHPMLPVANGYGYGRLLLGIPNLAESDLLQEGLVLGHFLV